MSLSKYWWVAAIGLAVVAMGANLIMVYFAVTDPGFAIEPDYYQKALDWDDHMAQQQANDDLGWDFSFDVSTRPAPDGKLEVRAVVLDSAGQPIDDARVILSTFHNAKSAFTLEATLVSEADGAYVASLPFRRPGLWEFRFLLERGTDRFTNKTVREIAWRR